MGEDEQPEISTLIQEPYEASSVSISFRLELKIPTRAFIYGDHVPRPPPKNIEFPSELRHLKIIENTHLFEFENLKLHPFYLSLLTDNRRIKDEKTLFRLKLITNVPKEGPILDYAIVCIDGRLFSLNSSEDFTPASMRGRELNFHHLFHSKISSDLVTIVCGIKASSTVSHSPPKETDPSEIYRLVCSFPREVPRRSLRVWSTSASSTAKEALAKYSLTGELPTLNVDLAKDLLSEENPELKALCVEYLMTNLKVENVSDVLRVASHHHVKDLVSKCSEFVSKYCRVNARNERPREPVFMVYSN